MKMSRLEEHLGFTDPLAGVQQDLSDFDGDVRDWFRDVQHVFSFRCCFPLSVFGKYESKHVEQALKELGTTSEVWMPTRDI